MKIIAFSGSLRTGSWNTKLVHLAAKELEARGATVDVWDFKAANIPVYDPDTSDTNPPPAMVDFKQRVRAADALLISSPEYNYSIPGALKNLIDFASRPPKENPFRGKVVGLMGTTPGPGGTLQGQIALRHVMHGMLCVVTPGLSFTISQAHEAFDDKGALKDEAKAKQLGGYLDRFVEEVKRHQPH